MTNKKNPYAIVKNLHITEKSRMLQELKNANSNPSIRACQKPKYVFIVDPNSNKKEIKEAIEEIYNDKNVKVQKVNTVKMKGKQRRVRGRLGRTAEFKKAIVTFEVGDILEEI